MYKPKNEFFNSDIDTCEILCIDYKLTRLSANCMQIEFINGNGDCVSKIQYENTIVFARIGDIITLNNSNWYTLTTKKWINKGLSPYNLYIKQVNFEWYIKHFCIINLSIPYINGDISIKRLNYINN